ncbi:VOC family protein [Niveibacterium sp. SC-1]|uniref:VOC family protein n=1 Tax=Niveibacterium sp. SC-1 TaxID=3135646 RepID=UPI00311E4EF0
MEAKSVQTIPALAVAGLVLYSPQPERLVSFYRDALGVPLEAADHGGMGGHHEAILGGTHLAIWSARKGHASASIVPTLRVMSLRDAEACLLAAGATLMHRPINLGEGKRVAGFADPDGRAFRLIEFI